MSEFSDLLPPESPYMNYLQDMGENMTYATRLALIKANAPELEIEDTERRIARAILRLDDTGAIQGSIFGRNVARNFYNRELSLDKYSGKINQSDEQQNRPEHSQHHIGMVGMVDLDRINSEEGHDGGNKAMVQTVQRIERAIREGIQVSTQDEREIDDPNNPYYNIYHFQGGEFAYTLDFHDMAPNERQEAVQKIDEALLHQGGTREDSLLLSTSGISPEKAITLYNQLQEKLVSDGRAPLSQEEMYRHLIGIARKATKFDLEIGILTAKVDKYIDMLVAQDPKASEYFEKYVQGRLTGSGIENKANFIIVGDAFEDRAASARELKDIAALSIREKVVKDFADAHTTETYEEVVSLDLVVPEELPEITHALSESDNAFLSNQDTKDSQMLSTHEVLTRGGKQMRSFKSIIDEMSGIREISSPDQINSLSLVDREKFVQLVAYHELFPSLRGNNSALSSEDQSLIQKIRGEAEGVITEQDLAQLKRVYKRAKEDYVLCTYRIDEITGLPNRREYIHTLREQLVKNVNEPSNVQVGFIDLGYLKYMNLGGREVGNYAIQRTAEIIEEAMRDVGVTDGQAFRYAGDEFTFLFNGSDDQSKAVIAKINEIIEEGDAIPRTQHSNPLYGPRKIAINYGLANGQQASETFSFLLDHGYTQVEDSLSSTESLLTRIADLSIDSQKALSRFVTILDLIRDLEEKGVSSDSIAFKQEETFVNFSKKALFGLDFSDLKAMANDPTFDYGTVIGLVNLQEFIRKKRATIVAQQTRKQEEEDEIVLTYVNEKVLKEQIESYRTRHAWETDQVSRQRLQAQIKTLEAELQSFKIKRETVVSHTRQRGMPPENRN